MNRRPNDPNQNDPQRRGRRMRADEIRRAREARQARQGPLPGRVVQPQPYKTRPSSQFKAVPDPKSRRRRRTIWLGVLAVGLSAMTLAAIFVLPVLIQLHQTADQVFVADTEPRPTVVVNPEGTPEVIIPEPSDDDNNDNDVDNSSEPDSPDLPDWGKQEPFNILLLGVDSRDEDEIARSDTLIIVSIDPAAKTVGMVSIPRDLLVTIPSWGDDKINAAYARGVVMDAPMTGPALTRATIEYNFGITIHYFAEVDFVGFINIVNTLGGVIIDVPAVIKDDNYEWTRAYFTSGPQHMDGDTALRYVRTRYDDNDFARGMRQQQVLIALRQQGVSLNLITKAQELLEELGDSARTDLEPRQVLALARLANDIGTENITTYSLLEATTEVWQPGQPYYLVPDWDKIDAIMDEMVPERPDTDDNIDRRAMIQIQNATFVDRLAARGAGRLEQDGFENVSTTQASDAGNHPASEIIVYGDKMDTARYIAALLGVEERLIVQGDPGASNGYDIVVILGDDAAAEASDWR
jgi:polyisoprenyl-teichoic acid--peptidoglycan teichoic acid transferase